METNPIIYEVKEERIWLDRYGNQIINNPDRGSHFFAVSAIASGDVIMPP